MQLLASIKPTSSTFTMYQSMYYSDASPNSCYELQKSQVHVSSECAATQCNRCSLLSSLLLFNLSRFRPCVRPLVCAVCGHGVEGSKCQVRSEA